MVWDSGQFLIYILLGLSKGWNPFKGSHQSGFFPSGRRGASGHPKSSLLRRVLSVRFGSCVFSFWDPRDFGQEICYGLLLFWCCVFVCLCVCVCCVFMCLCVFRFVCLCDCVCLVVWSCGCLVVCLLICLFVCFVCFACLCVCMFASVF